MGLADEFMDALSSIEDAQAALASGSTDDLEEVGNQLEVAESSVLAIQSRLAPGDDDDLDCVEIIPHTDEEWMDA